MRPVAWAGFAATDSTRTPQGPWSTRPATRTIDQSSWLAAYGRRLVHVNTAADATGTRFSALRILLVEDDLADVALIENAVAAGGLPTELHQVDDGEEAMAFLNRTGAHTNAPRPDLVILDLNMPRMNGREVLSAVKSDDHLKAIPIVVFTTSGIDADVLASYSAHANAYVTKPLDLPTFERVVSDIHRFYSNIASLPPAPPDLG